MLKIKDVPETTTAQIIQNVHRTRENFPGHVHKRKTDEKLKKQKKYKQ